MRPDGALDYVGRDDAQLKVRGFRVEPAEIVDRLLQDRRVAQAVVTSLRNAGGELQLCAYLVLHGGVTDTAAGPVIAELRRRYPRLRLFVSTTTLAGQQLARRSVSDVDGVFYFPFDIGPIVKRTMWLLKPRLYIMM